MKRLIVVVLVLSVAGVAAALVIGSAQSPAIGAQVVNLQALKSAEGFAQVNRPPTLVWPLDHGAHPAYQTEWWYYTGNLDATDGRHFGFQLTFFRRALTPEAPRRESDWATNQIYFAHFALTDVKQQTHFVTERFSRGAAGLAGSTGSPFRVWIDDWQAAALNPEADRIQLRAMDSGQALTLTLTAEKPVVLHGNEGLSVKSEEAGNVSVYYSFTRLAIDGTLVVNNEALAVRGLAWMDHEYGTTMLGPEAVGWDWFSVQLSDEREVMLFQIRRKDGSTEPVSSGTLVEPDGQAKHLPFAAFQVKAGDHWTSPQSRATYPSRWSLSIPAEGIDLSLEPYVADQEMRVEITYWEGAVRVTGRSKGTPVMGNGYVEMTGYAAGSP